MYLGIAAFILIYMAWCRFGTKPLAPGATIQATTAKEVAGMEKKTTVPVRVVVIADRDGAVKRLDIPPEQSPTRHEEIFLAVEVPNMKHGGKATVFLNTSSGEGRTVVQANKSPWFSFERNTVVGVEFGIGSKGRYYQGDVKRDILSVKGVTLATRAAVTSYPAETDWQAGVRMEKSFDWP